MADKQVISVPGMRTIRPYSQSVRAGGLFIMQASRASIRPCAKQLVVNTTVLVSDMTNFPKVNAAFAEYFLHDPPARMAMQVPLPKGLPIPIGCVAALDN